MIRVLIVDDEILARVGIQSLLENCRDIQVVGAFNLASDALDFMKTNLVDIVITDIEMPYMNGLEFIRKIREQHLAEGIVILSCYDKFEYAKQAISLGTDGYLLKSGINRESIEKEIHSVYEKISVRETRSQKEEQKGQEQAAGGTKAVAVIKMPRSAGLDGSEDSKGKMIVKLVNDIVEHYRMGHLIESYGERDPFVIFQFPENMNKEKRMEMQEGYIEALLKNIAQYTNQMPYIAVSREFYSMQKIPESYREAEDAAQMRFYREKKSIFYADEISWSEERPGILFEREHFLEEEGIGIFEQALKSYLERCKKEEIRVKTVQEVLMQAVSILLYSIEAQYFGDHEIVERNSRYPFMETVILAETSTELAKNLTVLMKNFREELLEQLKDDGFLDVLDYIERNRASGGISVQELADFKRMSLSLFTKKFKLKTGLAPIQYINQRKVELVKEYLKKGEYTLREIAELAGFSNENYMVRVFRKITGKTITDYRKGIVRKEN